MKLTNGTIVRMTPQQSESLLTLVNDQIEDLRHCLKKQGEEPHPDEWLTICLLRFLSHYRGIKRSITDLHYINTEEIRARGAQGAVNQITPEPNFFR